MQEIWIWTLGSDNRLEEGMVTHSNIIVSRIPMDIETWFATAHGFAKSQKWLSDYVQHSMCNITDLVIRPQDNFAVRDKIPG